MEPSQYNVMPAEVQQVFDSLVGDKILFGSRSMAARPATERWNPAYYIGSLITVDTDWDIAAEFNQENIDILQRLGFEGTDKLYVKDDLTYEIFKKYIVVPGPKAKHEVSIEVILRMHNTFFMNVWDNISAEYYYNNLWKRGPGFPKRYTKDNIKNDIRCKMNKLYLVAGYKNFVDEYKVEELL